MKTNKIVLCLCSLCFLSACHGSQLNTEPKALGSYTKDFYHAPTFRSYTIYRKLYLQSSLLYINAAKYSEPVTGKADPDKEYVYSLESHTYHITDDDSNNQYTVTDDEFYNWLHTKDVTDSQYDLIRLNLKGDTAALLNDYFDECYKDHSAYPDSDMNYRYFVDDEHDVLSLVMRHGITSSLYYSLHRRVYNIDLRTNKLMTNEEMLERYGLDKEQTQQYVFDQLNDLGFRLCNRDEVIACSHEHEGFEITSGCSSNCYAADNDNLKFFQNNHSAQIEQGGLFTTDNGKLRMIVDIEDAQVQLPGVEHITFVLVDIN